MPGKILDVESQTAQAKLAFGIIKHGWSGEIFDQRFLFGSNVLAEKLQIFRVDPGRNIAVSDDDRAFFGEYAISRNVIEMIVSVDYKLDGKLGDHADFAEESLRGGFVFKRVNHRDAVVADNEAGVGA